MASNAKFCSQCGHELPDPNPPFCSQCGARISPSSAEESPQGDPIGIPNAVPQADTHSNCARCGKELGNTRRCAGCREVNPNYVATQPSLSQQQAQSRNVSSGRCIHCGETMTKWEYSHIYGYKCLNCDLWNEQLGGTYNPSQSPNAGPNQRRMNNTLNQLGFPQRQSSSRSTEDQMLNAMRRHKNETSMGCLKWALIGIGVVFLLGLMVCGSFG